MSTINISPEKITGRCEYKCDYKFDYTGLTDFSMYNYNSYGLLLFGINQSNPSTAPVKYNGTDYQLEGIYLSSPSMHQFSSYDADAEILLVHNNTAGQVLWVCIPVIAHATASQSDFLSQSIDHLQAMTTTSSTFSLSNYNLNSMIPMDPYYTYKSKDKPWNWLVFGRPSAITISQQNLNTLTSLCGTMSINFASFYPIDASGAIYFNNAGPRHLRMDDNEIYIDCKPTDSKGNTESGIETKETSSTSNFNSTIFNTGGFQQFVLYLLLFLFVLGMFYVFYAIPTFFISLSGKPQPVAGPVVTNPGT
jgi:carbonic anhydrase